MKYWEELWDGADPEWRDDPPNMVKLQPGFCDYLSGRMWQLTMIGHADVDRLMLLGGQRFGYTYCVTACGRCRACIPAQEKMGPCPRTCTFTCPVTRPPNSADSS